MNIEDYTLSHSDTYDTLLTPDTACAISSLPCFPFTLDLLRQFVDHIDWSALSRNSAIESFYSVSFFREFAKRLDWEWLSQDSCVIDLLCESTDVLVEFSLLLDWNRATRHINVTLDVLRRCGHLINWKKLERRIFPIIDANPYTLAEFRGRLDWGFLSSHYPFTVETLRFAGSCVDWSRVCFHLSTRVTPEIFIANRQHIERFIIVFVTVHEPDIAQHAEAFLRYFTDQESCLYEEALKVLSSQFTAFTPELLTKFQAHLFWADLSTNPHLPFSTSLLYDFRDKWDWKSLWSNYSATRFFVTGEILSKAFDVYRGNTFECFVQSVIHLPSSILMMIDQGSYWKNMDREELPRRIFSTHGGQVHAIDSVSDLLFMRPFDEYTLHVLREYAVQYNSTFWTRVSEKGFICDVDLIREFRSKLNWRVLSGNIHLPITEDFLREFKDDLNWTALSNNVTFQSRITITEEWLGRVCVTSRNIYKFKSSVREEPRFDGRRLCFENRHLDKIHNSDRGASHDPCAICFQPIDDDMWICNAGHHAFHESCFKSWNVSCPLCRCKQGSVVKGKGVNWTRVAQSPFILFTSAFLHSVSDYFKWSRLSADALSPEVRDEFREHFPQQQPVEEDSCVLTHSVFVDAVRKKTSLSKYTSMIPGGVTHVENVALGISMRLLSDAPVLVQIASLLRKIA